MQYYVIMSMVYRIDSMEVDIFPTFISTNKDDIRKVMWAHAEGVANTINDYERDGDPFFKLIDIKFNNFVEESAYLIIRYMTKNGGVIRSINVVKIDTDEIEEGDVERTLESWGNTGDMSKLISSIQPVLFDDTISNSSKKSKIYDTTEFMKQFGKHK